MQYYAIIGDIKRFKKIENRCEIQEKLKKILDNVNSIYNNDISAKFLITLGDEFQGLLEMIEFLREQEKKLKKQAADIQISVYEKNVLKQKK